MRQIVTCLSGVDFWMSVYSQILVEHFHLPQLHFVSNDSITLTGRTKIVRIVVIARASMLTLALKSKHQRITSIYGCRLKSTNKKHIQLQSTDDCLYFLLNVIFQPYDLIISELSEMIL